MPDDAHKPLDQAAGHGFGPTLADVRNFIAADRTLPEATRNCWCGYLDRIGGWFGRPLETLPASALGLRFGLERLDAAAIGISEKTLANHRSELKAILRHAGLTDRAELSPEWAVLYDLLKEVLLRRVLSPFMHFCSAMGTSPTEACDATVSAYIEHVRKLRFSRKPRDLHRGICRNWNRAADTVAGWPSVRLTVPSFKAPTASLAWERFPASFVADIDAYFRLLSGDDLLAPDAPSQTCAERTLKVRRRYLQLAATAAVEAGVPIEQLASLADLVRPDTAKRLLDRYLAKEGGPTIFIMDLAQLLASIGRRWAKLCTTEQERLNTYFVKLSKHRKVGLTDKNLKAVREITDPVNYASLLALPRQLMDEACKLDPASPRAAVKAGLAVALQVLLLAPMRIRNLARLDLERHMSRRGDGTWHLHIADSEVKNRVPLDYPLPGPASELIDIYLREFRRRLARNGSTALFPGAGVGPKLETTLSGQITNLILKRIGIRITVHQFRHAAAAVILAANPGNYELVRRVLGHKNLTTTVRHYIGLETEAAVKLFQELVLKGGAKPAGDGA